ncbi:MAG: 30S ribosomal protein S17 [Deltaproteobacteria bacterium]|nr:30S ribosomal protein S17 [Deltaproteobacteria bacterium]
MKKQGMKRQLVGTVTSNKMDKTVVVRVERLVKHKFYHKYIRRRAKFTAHDQNNSCQIGDKVMLTECRPLSRSKRWRVSKIVQKAV